MEFLPNRNLDSNGPRCTFHETGLVYFNALASLKLSLSITQKYKIDVCEDSITFSKHNNGYPLRNHSSYRFNGRPLCREVIKVFGEKDIRNISFLVGDLEDNGFSLIISSKKFFKKEVSNES